MENDLNLLETLKACQPERYYLMKYEDFSVNTEVETENLFTFLGIDMSSSVRTFQRVQTNKKAMNSIANSFPPIPMWETSLACTASPANCYPSINYVENKFRV